MRNKRSPNNIYPTERCSEKHTIALLPIVQTASSEAVFCNNCCSSTKQLPNVRNKARKFNPRRFDQTAFYYVERARYLDYVVLFSFENTCFSSHDSISPLLSSAVGTSKTNKSISYTRHRVLKKIKNAGFSFTANQFIRDWALIVKVVLINSRTD